ncbi:MAG: FtsX-like permease family protein [Eubacteriales bacterium]|nr:FtsX-like permease family protein [Eubacteriales bacterium]
MKQNKSRTLVTVIGSVISVAMLTAVFIIGSSFLSMMQESVKVYAGKWHMQFKDVAGSETAKITDAEGIGTADVCEQLGFVKPEELEGSRKPYLYLTAHSTPELLTAELKEGRMPENSGELAIDQAFQEKTGGAWQVGDVVTLEYGVRTVEVDGETIEGNLYNFWSEEDFTVKGERTYTIVGTFTTQEYSGSCYHAYSALAEEEVEPDKAYQIYVTYQKPSRKMYAAAEELAQSAGNVEVECNSSLLFYMGVTYDRGILITVYGVVGIISAIILIASVSLIHNAFGISLSERSRMLGMLSSVGATRQQKRASVFVEAGIIGCIAIPIGIVCGILGIWITFQVIGSAAQNVFQTTAEMHMVIVPGGIAAVVALAVITLAVSAWFPARRASKIAPIDAIRQNQDIKIRPRNVRTPSMVRKLFGFEAELGLKNLKRSKHRYRVTVYSLVISVVLFLAASSFSLYVRKAYEMAQEPLSYDYVIWWYRDGQEADPAFERELLEVESADTRILVNYYDIGYLLLGKEEMTEGFWDSMGRQEEDITVWTRIAVLDDAAYEAYLKEAGLSKEELEQAETPLILVNNITLKEGHNFTDLKLLDVTPGQELSFWKYDVEKRVPIAAAAVTSVRAPFMMQYQESAEPVYFVTNAAGIEKVLAKAGLDEEEAFVSGEAQYTAEDIQGLEREAERICQDYSKMEIYTNDVWAGRRNMQSRLMVVSVFLYGFTVLISLVSLANIMNTISTGMALRRKEFAMFVSYGMTPGGVRKMVYAEGLFYGVKALVIAAPVSLAVMYGIYRVLQGNFAFGFTVPWGSVGIAVLGVFGIVGVTMGYAQRKLRGMNVVETLRNENL